MIKDELNQKIWGNYSPFIGFPNRLIERDSQGWSSGHPFLTEVIQEKRPQIIIEMGVWKGGSVITMGNKLKELKIDGAIIAVDTWLGAWDHWIEPNLKNELCFQNGYPRLFDKFLTNIINAELTDYVIPFPLDSVNAYHVIKARDIYADVIHIDGGHDYTAVQIDVNFWWKRLKKGGVMIIDDYNENGQFWPEVFEAVNDFLKENAHTDFSFKEGKCRFTKI